MPHFCDRSPGSARSRRPTCWRACPSLATWTAAQHSRTDRDRGEIAVGKRADLILVDGDPSRNIADIRKVALVIKNGTAYYPAEVHEALGIKRFAEPVPVQPAAAAVTQAP